MNRWLAIPLLAGLSAGLAGCYEEAGVTVYEPGVYKGDHDPLLDKMASEDHRDTLQARFRTVQMDR